VHILSLHSSTRNERELIDAGGASVDVVPAWRFLLDTDPVAG